MQILAHPGPNWKAHAVDTHPTTGQIALAVGRTVVLYSVDGKFEGELRATGHGAVVSVFYCRDIGLTHLLVVSTSERHVRIFDVVARRIVRSFGEAAVKDAKGTIISARFLSCAPHLILIVFDSGSCFIVNIQTSKCTVVQKRSLPLHFVRMVVDAPGYARSVFVVGLRGARGVVYSLYAGNHPTAGIVYDGAALHDIAITPIATGERPPLCLAITRVGRIQPVMLYTKSAYDNWTLLSNSEDNDDCRRTQNGPPVNSRKSTNNLRTSCVWLTRQDIITSDTRGALIVWRVMNDDDGGRKDNRIVQLCRRDAAHVRQVFAIVRLGQRQCVSISMDRTACVWRLIGCECDNPRLALCWRTLRSNGPVRAVMATMTSKPEAIELCSRSGDSDEHERATPVLAYTSAAGAVLAFALCGDRPFVLGEAQPISCALGKRGNNAIDTLVPLQWRNTNATPSPRLALYRASNGMMGVIGPRDGELQHRVCKLAKHETCGKPSSDLLFPVDGALLSVDENGKLAAQMLRDDDAENSCIPQAGDFKLNATHVATCFDAATISAGSALLKGGDASAGYIIGDTSGAAYVCARKECRRVPLGRKLGRVTCIAVDEDTTITAIADCQGALVTIQLNQCVTVASLLEARGDQIIPDKNKVDNGIVQSNLIQLTSERSVVKMAWNTPGNQKNKLAVFGESNGAINEMDKKYLVTVLKNSEVIVWELCGPSLKERSHIKEHFGAVNDVAWIGHQCLVTGGNDGTLRKWDILRLPTVK